MVDLTQYLPILIYLVIMRSALSSAFVFLPMGVARLTGTHNPTAEKLSEYECGLPRVRGPAQPSSDVRFYLIAILFIVFDPEAAFLFPGWAVSLDVTGWPGWITMMVFLFGVSPSASVYAWKKGALEWGVIQPAPAGAVTAPDVDFFNSISHSARSARSP